MVREPRPSRLNFFSFKHVRWVVLETIAELFLLQRFLHRFFPLSLQRAQEKQEKKGPVWSEWQRGSLQPGEPSQWFTVKNNIVLVDCPPSSGAGLIIWGASHVACSGSFLVGNMPFAPRRSFALAVGVVLCLLRSSEPRDKVALCPPSLASVYFFCWIVTDLAHHARSEGKSDRQEKWNVYICHKGDGKQ